MTNSTLYRTAPLLRSRNPMKRSAMPRPAKRMRHRSRKLSGREREWSKLKAQAKAVRGDVCQACEVSPLEGCSGKADDAHHMAGKLVQSLEVLLLVGRRHHEWITEHPKQARELGFSLRRNGPLRVSEAVGENGGES